jgi:hypothetical protein
VWFDDGAAHHMLGVSLQHYMMVSKVKNFVLGGAKKHAAYCKGIVLVLGGPKGDVFLM